MLTGQPMLVAAVLAACAGLATSFSPRSTTTRVCSWLLLLLAMAAVLLLALQLAVGDFSVRYVWQHSATYQPLQQRLAALVAGPEGTLLVWLLLASLVGVWSGERYLRSPAPDGGRPVHALALGIALWLAVITLVSPPFASLADAYPATVAAGGAAAEGRGLNPVLANAWMAPHTVLTLSAYALIGLAASLGLVQLLRVARHRDSEPSGWEPLRVRAARWAWMVLTLALLTGTVWAYEEMTFGWFWSWDPVESATLAIWLILTASLHSPRPAATAAPSVLLGPALSVLAFAAVLFASTVTRSGIHPSVHAFAGGTAGAFLGVGLALVLAALAATLLMAWRRSRSSRAGAAGSGSTAHPVTWWAALLLLGGGGLVAWGLGYPIVMSRLFGRLVDLDPEFFILAGYALAIAVLLLIGAGLTSRGRSRRDRAIYFAVFAALTILAAFVKPIDGLELLSAERAAETGPLIAVLGRTSILSLLPAAVYAALAVAERWWDQVTAGPIPARLRVTGHAALHGGVVLVLIGVAFSTLFATTVTVAVNPARAVADGGISVRLISLEQTSQPNALDEIVEEREAATLEVWVNGGRIAAGEAVLTTYPERDMGRHARVLIERGLLRDTQVIYHGLAEASPAGVPVTVRRIPLTTLVWGGMALLLAGMLLVQTAESVPGVVRGRGRGQRRGRGRGSP